MISFFIAAALSTLPIEKIAPILPNYAQPKYSKNEQFLAYLSPDEHGAYNIHVDGKCLTHENRAIDTFFWEPDDKHLLYLYDEKGDENYHLYRVNLEGMGEDVTPFPDVHVRFVSVDRNHLNHALIMMNLRDSRHINCYHLNLETKEIEPILPQVDHIVNVGSVNNLTPKVSLNFKPNGQKYVEVYENEAWRPLFSLDSDDWHSSPL